MKRGSDLEAFIRALKVEDEEELGRIKSQVEEDIADMIALRRKEVEERAREIIEEQSLAISQKRTSLELKYRAEILEALEAVQIEVCDKVRFRIEEKLDQLVSSDLYGKAIETLVKEIVPSPDSNVTVFAPPSEVDALSHKGYNVKDGSFERWGGCLVVDRRGGAVFENTFSGRLERLFPEVARTLAIEFNKILEKYEFISERLRLS